jgi:hypothetical protein
VSTVDLNGIKPNLNRPLCSIRKSLDQTLNLIHSQLLWGFVPFVKRNRTRADNVIRPASMLLAGKRASSRNNQPRRKCTRLAACVRELNTDFGALTMYKFDNSLQRRNLRFFP